MKTSAPRLVAACLLPALLAACGSERCEQRELKYYDQALSGQLTKNGVPNTIDPERGVCVPEKHAAQLKLALGQVDLYFHEVADLLKDACEERAFIAWARKEKLRYEVRDTLRADGSPGRRMFLLRSFSPEEVAVNLRRMANDAPKGVRCSPRTSK